MLALVLVVAAAVCDVAFRSFFNGSRTYGTNYCCTNATTIPGYSRAADCVKNLGRSQSIVSAMTVSTYTTQVNFTIPCPLFARIGIGINGTCSDGFALTLRPAHFISPTVARFQTALLGNIFAPVGTRSACLSICYPHTSLAVTASTFVYQPLPLVTPTLAAK
mgnify:CR=1 FL=1